jgi:hypothetical protein
MKGNGKIAGYGVNRKTISIQIEVPRAMAVVDELERYKGKMKTIKLDSFQVVGKIESITIRRSVGFLVHTRKLDFINRRLFHLMEKEPLSIQVSTPQQDKLLYLLDTIATKGSQKPEDLLFELTSFKKKDEDGPEKTIPGKRSVFDLSEAQSSVVFDKIRRLSVAK